MVREINRSLLSKRIILLLVVVVLIVVILRPNQTTEIQHRPRLAEGIKNIHHLDGAEHVGRVLPLPKGRGQQGVVAVAVRQEDVFGPERVDAQAGVQEEVELGDDEGGVPRCAGAARQDEVLEGPREGPCEDLGPGGLREGGCECDHFLFLFLSFSFFLIGKEMMIVDSDRKSNRDRVQKLVNIEVEKKNLIV